MLSIDDLELSVFLRGRRFSWPPLIYLWWIKVIHIIPEAICFKVVTVLVPWSSAKNTTLWKKIKLDTNANRLAQSIHWRYDDGVLWRSMQSPLKKTTLLSAPRDERERKTRDVPSSQCECWRLTRPFIMILNFPCSNLKLDLLICPVRSSVILCVCVRPQVFSVPCDWA